MNEQLRVLAGRIRNELRELTRVVKRIEEGWQRAQRYTDDYYLDSVALNLGIGISKLRLKSPATEWRRNNSPWRQPWVGAGQEFQPRRGDTRAHCQRASSSVSSVSRRTDIPLILESHG